MFGWDDSRDAAQEVYNNPDPNTGSWTHELVAGGAAFGAMKMFEDHQRKEGKAVSHQFAKELIAGFAGAEVDKLAETKGADAWDRHEAKETAQRNAEHLYDQQYGQNDQYDPNVQDQHDYTQNVNINYN